MATILIGLALIAICLTVAAAVIIWLGTLILEGLFWISDSIADLIYSLFHRRGRC